MPRDSLLILVAIAALVAGCNLSDPVTGMPQDAGAEEHEAENDTDSKEADVATPDAGSVVDAAPTDAPSLADANAADMTEVDMGTPVTAENFYSRYLETLCAAFFRIDYQPSDLWYWESPEDCVDFLTRANGQEVELITRDAQMGRLTIDTARATQVLEAIRLLDHPGDTLLTSIEGVFVPLADRDSACSTGTSCRELPDESLGCLKAATTGCEGVCAPSSRRCGDLVCDATQYCASRSPGQCEEKRADGMSCNSDEECLKHCVVQSFLGLAACGEIALDDDCNNNETRCVSGHYCEPTRRTCRPIADVGQRCVSDEGCPADAVCEADTCVAQAEGTACRDGACPEGLSCQRESVSISRTACFSSRNTGEPCNSDSICPETDFCDTNTSPSVCAPRHQIGDACVYSGQCDTDLVCRRTTYTMSGTCEEWQWGLAEGETCFSEAATCSFGLYCEKDSPDVLRGTCATRIRPNAGEACLTIGECKSAFCDGAVGMCVATNVDGAACTSPLECESGTCDPSTGSCAPSLCP